MLMEARGSPPKAGEKGSEMDDGVHLEIPHRVHDLRKIGDVPAHVNDGVLFGAVDPAPAPSNRISLRGCPL